MKPVRLCPTEQECQAQTDEARIDFILWQCVSRPASGNETNILREYLNKQRARIADGTLQSGEVIEQSQRKDLSGLKLDELAAWTLVSRVCLNLDETITHE